MEYALAEGIITWTISFFFCGWYFS